MGDRGTVNSPTGERWQVRRRWMDRRVPKLRLGSNRDDVAAEDAIDPRTWVEFDETFLPTLGAAAVAIVLLAVVLPLLGVAFQ